MYAVYVDDVLLFNTAEEDAQRIILNPVLHLEVNKAGNFTFIIPPGNALYDAIEKRKSIITVVQDGVEIFRGCVKSDETDIYSQKEVYCEGELSYFNDSLQAPYEFDGNPVALFTQLIEAHNSAVEAEKQFTIGTITAINTGQKAQVKTRQYTDTLSEINTRMLEAYGGYLKIRHENGTQYIDYLASTETNAQPVEFGVNLLDLKKNISAEELFTVLVPLGAAQYDNDNKPLDITSVNSGLNYLEDAEAVAKYGRIWQTKTWNYIDDPAALKTKGEEYLATGISEETTLIIKAVDMHFVNPDTSSIRCSDMVRVVSEPHGVDIVIITYAMDVDLLNPENTQYTFGSPRLTLTDNAILDRKNSGGGGGKTVEEEIGDIIRWADYVWDEQEAHINFNAGELKKLEDRVTVAELDIDGVAGEVALRAYQSDYNLLTERVSEAEVTINGMEAEIALRAKKDDVEAELKVQSDLISANAAAIALKADKTAVDGLSERVTQAEVDIDGANAAIALKANQTEVDEQGERLSQAELDINAAEAAIALKAEKTSVDSLSERVSQAEVDIDAANAEIALRAKTEALSNVANVLSNRLQQAEIDIAATDAAVRLKANQTDLDGTNERVRQAEIDIDGANAEIALKVNKDGIISAINLSSEEVVIQASKINLSGYVTASQFEALSAEIGNLTAGYTTAGWIRAENLDASIMADLKAIRLNGNAVSQQNVTMGSITSAGKALTTGGELDLSHSHAISIADDGTITLGEVAETGGNFNIADTKIYKDAVSAAYEEGKAAGGGTATPDLSDATGPVATQAGLATLASSLSTTSDKLIRCFSSVTVSNSGYYGFKVTAGSTTKYYYFIVT